MRESKEFQTLAAKSSPRRSSWSFVKFEDCQKGQTAAKTGCTPASGEGTKEESGEAGDTQSKLDKLEKETMDSMRDMPTDHPDFDKTATKMQKIAEAKIVDKIKSGETQEAKAMAEEAGLEYREVLEDAHKAAKEGVDIMEDLLGFPKEDRAEIKSDKKKEGAGKKAVDLEAIKKEYRENEDSNNHTENFLLLAKSFGTPEEVKKVEGIIKENKKRGYTSSADMQWMSDNIGPHYDNIRDVGEKKRDRGIGYKSDKKKDAEKWDWQKDGIPPDSSNTIGKKVGDVHGGKIAGRTKEKHASGGDTIYIKRDTRGWSGPQDPFVKVVVDKEGNVTHDYGSVPSLDSGPGPR